MDETLCPTPCAPCLPHRFQLLTLAIAIFALACVGNFAPYNRGSLFTALIVLYAATAGIAGYVAASYYKQMEGSNWVRLLPGCDGWEAWSLHP